MRNLLPLLLVPALATATPDPAPFAAKLDGAFPAKGNTVYSPTSISLALAMARAGAKGTTAEQMDRVMGTAPDVSKLLAGASDTREPVIAIANRIYADQSHPLEQAYLELTKKQFGAQAANVDFKHAADTVRKAINAWVAAQTHDKIKELLDRGTITADTRAVLVNAIYLKAQWAEAFQPNATAPAPFAILGGGSKKVTTMHGMAGAKTGSHGGARLLDLPYYAGKGPKLSMLIVVPENQTLPVVESDYQKTGLAPFLADAKTTEEVMVALPKFETRTSFELSRPLQKLGMTDAFDPTRADFSAMAKGSIVISKVIHQAWIKVDEGGTEAAAATAVVSRDAAAIAPPRSFEVDRSFLYFVHDDAGTVIFAGRITDPSAK